MKHDGDFSGACASGTARASSSSTANQRAIWARIAAFSLDVKGAPYPLSKRLSDEQDWSYEFTLRAIEEYKRFMFLAACAGHPVTPSFVTDEVWHTHLIYTRSYWEELGDILEKLIHHDPGTGEEGDKAFFEAQYRRTIDSYRKFFGEPPQDIWGSANRDMVKPKGRLAK